MQTSIVFARACSPREANFFLVLGPLSLSSSIQPPARPDLPPRQSEEDTRAQKNPHTRHRRAKRYKKPGVHVHGNGNRKIIPQSPRCSRSRLENSETETSDLGYRYQRARAALRAVDRSVVRWAVGWSVVTRPEDAAVRPRVVQLATKPCNKS